MHLWPVGAIPLLPECRFHLEIVFVSPKTVSVCSRNTHFGKSEDTSGKALLSQQKEKSKPPKKQNYRNNKKNNKGPKPSQSAPLKNDKGSKPKGNKTEHHCDFCGKDNHDESKCFKKMATLEATMKKHHISLDSSSESTSHGNALCASGYSYTASSSSTSNEWLIDSRASERLIDSRASYHMAKDQAIFSTMHECNTKQIFVGDDRSLSVVGSGQFQ